MNSEVDGAFYEWRLLGLPPTDSFLLHQNCMYISTDVSMPFTKRRPVFFYVPLPYRCLDAKGSFRIRTNQVINAFVTVFVSCSGYLILSTRKSFDGEKSGLGQTGSNRGLLLDRHPDGELAQYDLVQEQHAPALDAGPHDTWADAPEPPADPLILVYHSQADKHGRSFQ
jgi:hypothetical protein